MNRFYYDQDVMRLITEYAIEMELLEALLEEMNTQFRFINLELEDLDDFDEFRFFMDRIISTDHVMLTRACDVCQSMEDGLYTWIGDSPMKFKDVLLFTKAKICFHERVARVEIRHNVVVVFCFQL